ncbi:MAG TPA: enolase C-terminal domain-like protein [Candidatus Micrarchaeaceae archaeon]|nr:enolase C-terminal domain-like protein [Candidatus Micrarchaeaceae archaeon]
MRTSTGRDTRITRVRSSVLDLPLPDDFRPAWGRNEIQRSFFTTIVQVETESGITGISAAEAGPESAISIDRFVAPHLIGQDAAAPEPLTGVLKDSEIVGAPVYCVEIALWDIAGKVAGLPVRKALGRSSRQAACVLRHRRGAIGGAANRGPSTDHGGGLQGGQAAVHSDDPRQDVWVVETLRAEVGDRLAILVDANQAGVLPGLGGHRQWNFHVALEVGLEEPLPRHDYAGLRRLRDRLGTLQLAGGENNRLAASVPNHSWFEFRHEPPGWPASALSQMLVKKHSIHADGCLAVPDRPELGFDLDEELIERYTVARRLTRPLTRARSKTYGEA